MEQSEYIVAIEIGSYKLSGIVGKKQKDGSIQILSYASEPSSSFIRKGVVFNIDKTASCLTNIINRLEGEDLSISKVYVGLSGKSMRTVTNLVTRVFDNETKVTQPIMKEMDDENFHTVYSNLEILSSIPQEYKLEDTSVSDPVGVLTKFVEGRYVNVVAAPSLKKRLQECFANANIEVADFLISPICLADAVLTDTERHSGCALVDFGADTTTVSIYKNNILRSLVVLPIGGNNITKDLALLLKIDEDEAENLKLEYGVVVGRDEVEAGNDDNTFTSTTGAKFEMSYINNIISARAEEIVANVWNVIQRSGYENQLVSGIRVVGGTANLTGMLDLMERTCKKMKVRKVRNVWSLNVDDCASGIDVDALSDTLLALLVSGKEVCCVNNTLHDGKLFDRTQVEETPKEPEDNSVQEQSAQNDSTGDENKGSDSANASNNKKTGEKKNKFKSFYEKLFGEGSDIE